jgi:hypothetical protein
MNTSGSLSRKIAVTAAVASCGAAIAVGSILAFSRLSRPADEKKESTCGCQYEAIVTNAQKIVANAQKTSDVSRIEETFVENWVPYTPNPIPTSTDKQIFTVVLTGGPCGGKSSCLQYLSKRLREDYSIQVFLAPEIPTMFKNVCECPFPFRGSKQHQMVWEGTKMRMKVRSVDVCY